MLHQSVPIRKYSLPIPPISHLCNNIHNQHKNILQSPHTSMARHLLLNHYSHTFSCVPIAIGTLLLSAFALFLCVGHSRRRWHRWRACYGYGSQEPVIQLNPEEIIGYQHGDADPNTYSGEGGPVWKKNILMGGKCQLPDFSGVIIYDSAGNVVNPGRRDGALPALPWK